jgi:hypothetical protein
MSSLVLWSDPTGRVVVSWKQGEPDVARYEMFVRLSIDAKGISNGRSAYRSRHSAISAAKRKARQLIEGDLLDALRGMVDHPPGNKAYMAAEAKAREVIALAETAGIGKH